MTSLRHQLRQHRGLAFWLVGFALLMRIAVPAGYMPMFSGRSVTIELCPGYAPMQMAMPGMADHREHKSDHGRGRIPCGFSALATPSLAGADPILPVVAVAFAAAAMTRPGPRRRIDLPSFLRPPLRGPPTA